MRRFVAIINELDTSIKTDTTMKKADISHWENIQDIEGLLFFAQSVDEMLFDFTLDSYKPLALNSRLLCIECLESIEEVRNGFIQQKNLISIIEELVWSLRKDIAAREIFGVKYDHYIEKIKSSQNNLYLLENIVRLIYTSFQSRQYLKSVIKCLNKLIKDGKDKERIRQLTSSFITELVNYGYNQHYIYYQNLNFFFTKSKRDKISSIDEIEQFFNLFDFEIKEFTAVFKGGIIFRNFKDTLNKFNIVVTRTYNCFSAIPDDINFKNSRKENESFIICSKIEAFDHHSARQKAEDLLGQICNAFNFFHHRTKPEIFDVAIIARNKDNYVVIIDKPNRSVLKSEFEENPVEAAKSVEKTLNNLELTNESTYRFSRSIDLHSAALSATAIENQLLDFWAALETLLPKISDSNKDRIVQICDSLVPFLQLNYINKILLELKSDICLWNQTLLLEILDKIVTPEGFTQNEKFAALIALDENKTRREELYAQLSDYPLLKNRIYAIYKSFSSVDNIEKILNNHRTKINWHIRRIYRTRGQIIHSGKYPSYTPILIENLHSYIDLFLNRLISISIEKKIHTIEDCILEIQIQVDYQNSLLSKHKGENLTLSNLRDVLFGEQNNASA